MKHIVETILQIPPKLKELELPELPPGTTAILVLLLIYLILKTIIR